MATSGISSVRVWARRRSNPLRQTPCVQREKNTPKKHAGKCGSKQLRMQREMLQHFLGGLRLLRSTSGRRAKMTTDVYHQSCRFGCCLVVFWSASDKKISAPYPDTCNSPTPRPTHPNPHPDRHQQTPSHHTPPLAQLTKCFSHSPNAHVCCRVACVQICCCLIKTLLDCSSDVLRNVFDMCGGFSFH